MPVALLDLLSSYRNSIIGCSDKIGYFSKNFPYFPPLPRKHWAAISCTEIGQIGQPGVTVHLHCVESFEYLLQRYLGEG